jgi:hypothetical protein
MLLLFFREMEVLLPPVINQPTNGSKFLPNICQIRIGCVERYKQGRSVSCASRKETLLVVLLTSGWKLGDECR